MSTLFVKVVKITKISPHNNADRLEVCHIKGWECVTKKDQFKVGDLAVYVPVDARIPYALEERLFKDAKIKLDHGRIKTIRLRGMVSQGLLIKPDQVPELGALKEEQDVAGALKITKYEPPEPGNSGVGPKSGKQRKKTPGFIRYTDIENIKWYNDAFKDGDLVVMTEKLHGTSARYTLTPTEPKNIWQKIKKFFGLDLGMDLVCGTRETEQYETDPFSTWAKIGRQFCIKQKLKPGEIVFGEIIGNGIQTGYDYGYVPGHHGFFVYDVSVLHEDGTRRFLDHEEIAVWCLFRGLNMVPVFYIGPYSEETLKTFTQGPSWLDPKNPTREGTVVRPIKEEKGPSSCRKVLKSISPIYALNKKNSEFH